MADTQFILPSRDEALAAARRELARKLVPGELVWITNERYDAPQTMWYLDAVKLGVEGRWVRMRHRYDAQAETLYFLGESPLSDAEFRAARQHGTPFDVAEVGGLGRV
jgi:hypothetical protein